MEKTGSTSIQKAIHQSRAQLQAAAVVYPSAGITKLNHNLLASAYIPAGSNRRSRGLSSHMCRGKEVHYLDNYRSRVLEEIRRGRRVLISGEHLFRLNPDEIAHFRRDLDAAGVSDAKVFGVLRSPASFYLSLVQQELKASSTFPEPDRFFVPYAERVSAWQKHFTCTFSEFSAMRTSQVGVVGKFVQEVEKFLEVDLPALHGTFAHANDSLSPEEMQVVQDFRRLRFPRDDGKFNRPTARLIRNLNKLRDDRWRKPVLRSEVGSRIARRHFDEAASLLSLCGIQLDVALSQDASGFGVVNDVKDILANFDESLYRDLSNSVSGSKYGPIEKFFSSVFGPLRKA